MNEVPYDTTATAAKLGITLNQLKTLTERGHIVPCNHQAEGTKKWYRRYNDASIAAAIPHAEALKAAAAKAREPKQSRLLPAGDDAAVLERLARIEALLEQILAAFVRTDVMTRAERVAGLPDRQCDHETSLIR